MSLEFRIEIIAVQNEWHSLRFALILLDFSINIYPSQNQVHRRRGDHRGIFSFDPIPRSAGLDQKPLPFGVEIENRLMAMAPIKNLVLEGQKPFYQNMPEYPPALLWG